MGSREEEYLRRMKALGYEPSLAGMDDDDIEWELSKMEEAERRREGPSQPLRTVYRPVDPGLKARILRMFGQPYDESAIPKGQEFYLNGWDNGEDREEVRNPVSQSQGKKSDFNAPDFDPWKNAWKLDWGKESDILADAQKMVHWPTRDGATLPSRGAAYRPLSYENGGQDAGVHMKNTTSDNPKADGLVYPDLTDEQKLFLATVAGEAGGNSEAAQRAVAHVIMNRVGYKGYEGRDTVGEVLTPDQFESISKQNVPFRRMAEYLKNRDGSDPEMERIINAAMNVYHRKEPDFTGGAILFYSPEGDEEPPWEMEKLQKLVVSGAENDNFWFYRYK